MKKCSRKDCKSAGVLQPISNFYKRVTNPDGYNSSCKDCWVRINREHTRKRKESNKDFFDLIIGGINK